MSTADKAKTDRTSAKRQLTMAINNLNAALKEERHSKVVEDRFESVKTQWGNVMEKHATYLANAYPDETSEPLTTEDEWLESCFKTYTTAEVQAGEYIEASSDSKQSVKLKQSTPTHATKKARNSAKFELTALRSSIDSVHMVLEHSHASESSVTDVRDHMKQQLNVYHSKQREYVDLLSDEEDLEEQAAMMSKMQALYTSASLEAGKIIQQKEKALTKVEKKSTQEKGGSMEMKLERMKMPSFSGNIRDFPCFKNDFKKQVMPLMKGNSDAAVYALRSCLKDEPSDLVRNVSNDIEEMWKRLDERYGRLSKLTDAIMYDIKQLKAVPDSDNKRFIDLVNTIERAYRDLKAVNMESELSNSTIVSIIEERLPPHAKSMWCLKVSDKDSTVDDVNKFPHLLEFLLQHRRAIEYASSDLRTTKRCTHVSFDTTVQHHVKEEAASTPINTLHAKPDSKKPGSCWLHANSGHDILACRTYMDMTPRDRWDMAYEYGVCWSCLRTGHRKGQCYQLKKCTVKDCKDTHHPTLHEERSTLTNENVMKQKHVSEPQTDSTKKATCMLQLMRIHAGRNNVAPLNVMWDSGAQVTMITFRKAKELDLSGVRSNITIVKIGGEKQLVESRLYEVPLHDTKGNVEMFRAYGIDQISTPIQASNTEPLASLFQVDSEQVGRPCGEIDMLIGFDYAGFHPERQQSIDHLLLMTNRFGMCISGSRGTTQEKTQLLVHEAEATVAHIKFEDFYNTEALGVACHPRCGSCRCGECPPGGKQYTLKEERELTMIEDGLELHENKWIAHYPWLKSPTSLPNNYNAAFAMLRSTEKRLGKSTELAKLYTDQIADMENRGVAKKLSAEDMRMYQGPVYYISHHEVIKPDSMSTPCRIVFNSSARYLNQTLNDYWAKGPDMLNNLLAVLLRFRENKVAVAGDISKMYHTIAMSEQDQHTHRFLWRKMNEQCKPDVYTMTAVSFGDKPAAAIAAVSLRKTAEMGEEQFPEASNTIKKNSYVDDIIDSFNNHAEAEKITEDIDRVLAMGGFKIKEWEISGESTSERTRGVYTVLEETTANPSSKVLGIVWDSQRDCLRYVAKVNFSQKKRKMHTEPNLAAEDAENGIPEILTRRVILSLVNGIYDPLGLAAPFVVTAKILLRRLTMEKLDWDDAIPETERDKWVLFFLSMFKMEELTFHRSTKPPNAIGDPSLVIFSDASEEAFGCCAYVRWSTPEGAESRLLMAKSRLAPVKKITMPRLELNGALMGARVKDFIEKETTMTFKKIYMIVDSEIVRAQIQKESYGFNTFVGVRIGEIRSLTRPDDWYWVDGSVNIADIISRGRQPEDLASDSEWQTGPSFLKDQEEHWPIKQSYVGDQLPDQIIMKVQGIEAPASVSNAIDINRFSSYSKLMRVTARIISMFRSKPSLSNCGKTPDRYLLQEAEQMWITDAQRKLSEHVKPETMKRLGVQERDGMMVAGGRLEEWTGHTYDDQNPVLLSAKSPLAELYAQQIHSGCHLGVSSVVAKIRRKYWIVGLRDLVKRIQRRCILCKKLNKDLQTQIMGKLPAERLKEAPAWSYCGLDLFGPFAIRGTTNKRSRSKGYGVIITCLLSRSVHLELVPDYGTESFLLSIRRFASIRGCPIKIWSDRGSQLRAANKEMKQAIISQDEDALKEFGCANSIDWEFTAPDAPWQNGCAESLVKSAKKAISIAVGAQVLTFSEMQTVLYEAANLLNERPIGRIPSAAEDGPYLCPNDLLLGRSTRQISGGPFNMPSTQYACYKSPHSG